MRASTVVCYALAASSLLACAAPGGDESEEDAVAETFAGGKGDELGFQLGPFTREPSSDAKEPLIAVFHASGRTGGESGHFDLVTYEEYEPTYDSGTYKLYQYRGRDRIRFTNGDGHVVLRSDWSYADGTLTLGEGNEMSPPKRLAVAVVDCVVVDVLDSNAFEEGLSPHEYPSVSVDRDGANFSLEIGNSSFDSSEATIAVTAGATAFEAVATLAGGDKIIIRVPNQAPRRGEILQVIGGNEDSVATIVCRP